MRVRVLIAAWCALALMAAGCTGDDHESGAPRKLDEVTYLTGFGINGRESYVFTAVEKGFFRDAGIKVTVQPGQAGAFVDNAVAANKAQFGIVDASGVFVRFANTPVPERRIKAVALIHQRTLLGISTLEGSGIRVPADLQKRTIGVATGTAPKALFPLYAKLAGINPALTTWKETKPELLVPLLVSGQVDGIGLFVASAPQIAAAEKTLAADRHRPPRAVVTLPYSDYMSDMLGAMLITNADLANRDPGLVRRFSTALMRGLEYACIHPDEGGAILHRVDGKYSAVTAANELAAIAPYTRPPAGHPYGSVDEQQVARAIALLENLPMPRFTPSDLVAFGLTPGAA